MFDRILKIVNENDFKKIQKLNILIVGIGGVGGYTLETLVRMGVLNITIVDHDTIDISNINRQIIALNSNIGEKKVNVAKKRALDINPNINIKTIDEFILDDNIDKLNINEYDYVVDACDTLTTKLLLIKKCHENNIKIISCMGTGNKFHPELLEITDIYKTEYDPLAKRIRSILRKDGIKRLTVIASKEKPIKTDSTPGSTSLVPSVAGILISSYIINDTIK